MSERSPTTGADLIENQADNVAAAGENAASAIENAADNRQTP